jgi:hypothetical protein
MSRNERGPGVGKLRCVLRFASDVTADRQQNRSVGSNVGRSGQIREILLYHQCRPADSPPPRGDVGRIPNPSGVLVAVDRRRRTHLTMLFAATSENRIVARREDQVALRNHTLMIFATALDPIFRISAIGRPEAHDLITTSCCGSNTRLNELNGLADPELVGEVGHRENLLGLRR